jgi:hypothetical protein
LSWVKEKILILVKAAPNWSRKYRKYEICTAGIDQNNSWRRLYPFPEDLMIQKGIRVWDLVEIETKNPTDDPRLESRKINAESLRIIDRIEDRNERRKILLTISETSLDIPIKEKRSLTIIRPRIEDFSIQKKPEEQIQITLNGKIFRQSPYGNVNLIYKWRCPKPCQFCKTHIHTTKCFDWGANFLYRKYKDEKEARKKVKEMCHYKMVYDCDTWFALGTHRMRPWKKWMIVGLLWMKKERTINTNKTILLS